jgi:predicted membrane channel-forming protein YqfA (hemolysin III family)
MNKEPEKFKKFVFIGIILISLGVSLSTTIGDKTGSLGTVLVALGGLFFIIGMSLKKKSEEHQ